MLLLLTLVAGGVVLFLMANTRSAEKRITHQLQHLYPVGDPQFIRSMGALLGPPLLPGNRITPLQNGDEIFPAMLQAIRSAERTIAFETYIYWSGSIGRAFAEALTERAKAGVKVHVLLDWVGSGKMDSTILDAMREGGVQVVKYHPLRWYNLGRLNNRTHRKLLIVDGRIGFTGGVGIADNWLGHAEDPEHWRDAHFALEGPAVAQMQAAFMDNWTKTQALVLHGEEYFPPLERAGDQLAQVFMSSPSGGSESLRLMYLLSITSAARSIRIANAYFVPDALAVETLIAAQKRGVTIEIVVPGRRIDTMIVRQASRSRWGPLLEAGISIYEYQPTMYHIKAMIVDEAWVSVGSTNFDNRSFRLNDEANLNVLHRDLAAALVREFEVDKTHAKRITLVAWRNRPWWNRAVEWLAGLLRMQL
jgi:cardiolipin synthase